MAPRPNARSLVAGRCALGAGPGFGLAAARAAFLRRIGGRQVLAGGNGRGAARLVAVAGLGDQRGTLLLVAEREVFPPGGDRRIEFTGIGAQAQEVEAGAEARLLDQRERA